MPRVSNDVSQPAKQEAWRKVGFMETPEVIATLEVLSPVPIPIPVSFAQLLSSIQEDSQEPEWAQQGPCLRKLRKPVASAYKKFPSMHSGVPGWVEYSHHDDSSMSPHQDRSRYGEYTQDLLLIAYGMQRMVAASDVSPLPSGQVTSCSPMRVLGLRESVGGKSYRKMLGSIRWNRYELGGPLPFSGPGSNVRTGGDWTRRSSMPVQRELSGAIDMDVLLPRQQTGGGSNERAVTATRDNIDSFPCPECSRYPWYSTSPELTP